MPVARILVDGYSLLHAFPEMAPGKARYSEAARSQLIAWLTQYRDAIGTPITVIFDGAQAPAGISKQPSTPEMEVLFSSKGKTADDLIERAATRLAAYGEVLVVTNDYEERNTIEAAGGFAYGCETFISMVNSELATARHEVKEHNRREIKKFKSKSA